MSEEVPIYAAGRRGRRPPDDASAQAIHRAAPIPYYAQLAAILRDNIERGHWQPGEALPSESDLGSFFGLSRTVVRQALGRLVDAGLVHTEKGRGTFVARRAAVPLAVRELRGSFEELSERSRVVETDVLGQRIVAVPSHVAPELGVSIRSRVVQIQRVRFADAEPVVAVETYLPLPRFAALTTLELTDRSLYAVIADLYDVRPGGGDRRIQAAIAGEDMADLLGIEPSAPVLSLTATTRDQHGTPFEHFHAVYRADRTSFHVGLGPAG